MLFVGLFGPRTSKNLYYGPEHVNSRAPDELMGTNMGKAARKGEQGQFSYRHLEPRVLMHGCNANPWQAQA